MEIHPIKPIYLSPALGHLIILGLSEKIVKNIDDLEIWKKIRTQ